MVTSQLIIEDITHVYPLYQRVLMCDPNIFYQRIYEWNKSIVGSKIEFSHYKRQNYLTKGVLFPQENNTKCSCGCGNELKGRRTRWATDKCVIFSNIVRSIISGDTKVVRNILENSLGLNCKVCGIDENTAHELYHKDTKSGIINSQIHLDHIIPVYKGGGGCWLGNYQFLCSKCHKEKTKKDKQI